ncbi:MAG: hypothetical protein KA063_01210 [Firmicutes bacterium]|nr:hypothetical protein [Bacillota bacterium]
MLSLCAMVLAANAVWWKMEHGYPMGMSLFDALPTPGRALAGAASAAVPTAGDGKAGPMLSLDIDLTADPGPEVVSSRWTSSQDGVIELYARNGSSAGAGGQAGYRLLDRVEAGPVVELSCATLLRQPEGGSSAVQSGMPVWGTLLVVAAEYDQRVGAMSKSRVTTAYAWDGRRLAEVWSATTCSEAVWNLAWDAPKETGAGGAHAGSGVGPGSEVGAGAGAGSADWMRLTSLSKVDFVASSQAGSRPSIVLRSSHKYESYNEDTDVFTTIKSREVVQTYYWNDKWSAFILSEATVGQSGASGMEYPGAVSRFNIAAGTVLAVLESESQCAEGLVFGPPHLLKVKTPDGRRCFVDDGSVVPTPSRAMV